jgi:hypothetical protein
MVYATVVFVLVSNLFAEQMLEKVGKEFLYYKL